MKTRNRLGTTGKMSQWMAMLPIPTARAAWNWERIVIRRISSRVTVVRFPNQGRSGAKGLCGKILACKGRMRPTPLRWIAIK